MPEDSFSDRFAQIVRQLGGQNAAARVIGITQGGVHRLISGGEPTLSTIKMIAEKTGQSLLWLATGDIKESFNAPDTILIPLRDVAAAAGAGMAADDEAVLASVPVPRLLAERWGRPLGKVEAIFVRGDSMEPTIQDGAVVLIDRAEQALSEGRIFAFRTPDGLRLKRFQLGMDGAAMLVSDNKALYIPERIERSQIDQMDVAGRVFWTGRMV